MKSRPIIVGVAGGIGSGKSMFASAMKGLGCVVVDADAAAHEVLQQPDIQETLASWWGSDVRSADGVDRAKIAQIVFQDPEARRKLEGLVHPRVEAMCRGRIDGAEPARGVVVLDAPLLFEAGLDAWCDCVVFIDNVSMFIESLDIY